MARLNSSTRALRTTTAGLAAAIALTMAGCSAHQGSFRVEGSGAVCRVHQGEQPGTAYTGGVNGDTEAILAMMGDLTAHGGQPYCDGRSANSDDLAWSSLYTSLGGIPARVAPAPR